MFCEDIYVHILHPQVKEPQTRDTVIFHPLNRSQRVKYMSSINLQIVLMILIT